MRGVATAAGAVEAFRAKDSANLVAKLLDGLDSGS